MEPASLDKDKTDCNKFWIELGSPQTISQINYLQNFVNGMMINK